MRNLFFVILLLISLNAWSLQLSMIKDNQTAFFKISAKELTRIFVSNDRIQTVRGLDGTYQITKDEINGSIFIKPEINYQNKAFNLFVSTEEGHNFILFLNPIDIPGGVIEIRPVSAVKNVASRWEKNSPYDDLILNLMNDMENGEQPEGYAIIRTTKVKYKKIASGIKMGLLTIYKGNHISGEIWVLHNPCKTMVYLHPGNFYQSNARAIAIQNEQLAPSEDTIMYRIINNE